MNRFFQIIFLIISFLLLTDYVLFSFGNYIFILFAISLLLFKPTIDSNLVLLTLCALIAMLPVLLSGKFAFGFVLFPIAWLVFSGFRIDSINTALKLAIVFLFFIALTEVITVYFFGVKFTFIIMKDVPLYRWDLFRAATLWGSPLTLASLALILFVATLVLNFSRVYSLLAFSIIVLTGSRSSFILAVVFFIAYRPDRFIYFAVAIFFFAIFLGNVEISENSIFRGMSVFSSSITSDSAVVGRKQTSLSSFDFAIENFPQTLFPTEVDKPISDSAFVSYWLNYGALSFALLLTYIVSFTLILNISFHLKVALLGLLIILGLSIGGSFSPVVLFTMALILRASGSVGRLKPFQSQYIVESKK